MPAAHEHGNRRGEKDRRQREGQPAMPIDQIAERFKAHCGNGASARVRSSLTVETALPTATSRQLPAVASKAAKGWPGSRAAPPRNAPRPVCQPEMATTRAYSVRNVVGLESSPERICIDTRRARSLLRQ